MLVLGWVDVVQAKQPYGAEMSNGLCDYDIEEPRKVIPYFIWFRPSPEVFTCSLFEFLTGYCPIPTSHETLTAICFETDMLSNIVHSNDNSCLSQLQITAVAHNVHFQEPVL